MKSAPRVHRYHRCHENLPRNHLKAADSTITFSCLPPIASLISLISSATMAKIGYQERHLQDITISISSAPFYCHFTFADFYAPECLRGRKRNQQRQQWLHSWQLAFSFNNVKQNWGKHKLPRHSDIWIPAWKTIYLTCKMYDMALIVSCIKTGQVDQV